MVKLIKAQEGQIRGTNEDWNDRKAGWKIHLNVDPKNYDLVFTWLYNKSNCPYGWKHLAGGEVESQDFTIYVGSWTNLFQFGHLLTKSLSEYIDPPTSDLISTNDSPGTNLVLTPIVSARFDTIDVFDSVEKSFLNAFGVRDVFMRYTICGCPRLKGDAPYHDRYGNGKFFFVEVIIRGYSEASRRFGEYFHGPNHQASEYISDELKRFLMK